MKEHLFDLLASTIVQTGYLPVDLLAFLQRTPLPAASVGSGESKWLTSEEYQTGDAQIGAHGLRHSSKNTEKNGTWTRRCRVIYFSWIKACTYQF